MNTPNGHASQTAHSSSSESDQQRPDAAAGVLQPPALVERPGLNSPFIPEKVKEVVAVLEVPFDPAVIEWRVTNTAKGGSPLRGQVIPYADQRAYTDRLNALFTPAGWTRRYQVHTSASFERGKDKKTVAKVLVTCELTIHGLGSHSATGEEWADDDNAGTAAEAQSFKRACTCFGLGRYLYFFAGQWVDLDERKRPKRAPKLPPWATPEGWRQGPRPAAGEPQTGRASAHPTNSSSGTNGRSLIMQIEHMQPVLGSRLYTGLLRSAKARRACDIRDRDAQARILAVMQSAARGMGRLKAALESVGQEPLDRILKSIGLSSVSEIETVPALKQVVDALEAQVRSAQRSV